MLTIDPSVALCQNGHAVLIARDLMQSCSECGRAFCPQCSVQTSDPDVRCCSDKCAAEFSSRIEREAPQCDMPKFAAAVCGMEGETA